MLQKQQADATVEDHAEQQAAGYSDQAGQTSSQQQQPRQQQPPAAKLAVIGHDPPAQQLVLGASGRAASCSEPMDLQLLEATLMSPNPFCPRSFITGDATIAPVSKKQRSFCAAAVREGTLEEGQPALTPGGSKQAQGQRPVSSAGLDAGTMAGMLAAEAARSAAMERYSSMALFSPSGGFLLDPARTQQLSLALAGDGDPRGLSETPAAGTLEGSRLLMSPAVMHAGSKRPYSAARLDDRCTEICEAAQAVAMSSPTQEGSPSLAALMQWQHTIQAAEQQWGSSHPAVGRAWLELARALQAADKDSDRAKHATKKAFDICMTSMKQTGTESHAQESFEYLLAKFNTKATAAKQAAAAASSEQKLGAAATDAVEASTPAAAAAAAAVASPAPAQVPASSPLPASSAPPAAPVAVLAPAQPAAGRSGAAAAPVSSMPSAITSQAAVSAAEQLQMPFLGSSYLLYPPVSQHLQLGAYPAAMSQLALHALGGLPTLQASGSPVVMASAAQLMPTDLQAAALMNLGYPAALLPHTLLQAAGTPTAECLTLMQPSLLFAPPGRLPVGAGAAAAAAAAALGSGAQAHVPGAAGEGAAASSRQDRAPPNKGGSKAAAPKAAGVKAAAARADDGTTPTSDQQQAAQAKARKVLNLQHQPTP